MIDQMGQLEIGGVTEDATEVGKRVGLFLGNQFFVKLMNKIGDLCEWIDGNVEEWNCGLMGGRSVTLVFVVVVGCVLDYHTIHGAQFTVSRS